ncbi:MAG: hypothetical protein H7255_16690 [Ramlibacter sp.]|nr:hypothetical protein [Ramlibacter sp.]
MAGRLRCDEAPAVLVGRLPVPVATNEVVLNIVVNEQTMPPSLRGVPDPLQDFLDCEGYRAEGGYSRLALIAGSEAEAVRALAALDASGLGCASGAMLAQQLREARETKQPFELSACVHGIGPAGFRDRQQLERDPHRFLEGLLIAARIARCEAVTIFLPDEPQLHAMLQSELLALLASQPCNLPSITLLVGDAPLDALSLETLCWVRGILDKGADWFGGFGRNGSCGLRSLAVAGRVADPCVKVVPAGVTLGELIEDFCGGMEEGHDFRAALVNEAMGTIVVLGGADRDHIVEGAEVMRDAAIALK